MEKNKESQDTQSKKLHDPLLDPDPPVEKQQSINKPWQIKCKKLKLSDLFLMAVSWTCWTSNRARPTGGLRWSLGSLRSPGTSRVGDGAVKVSLTEINCDLLAALPAAGGTRCVSSSCSQTLRDLLQKRHHCNDCALCDIIEGPQCL